MSADKVTQETPESMPENNLRCRAVRAAAPAIAARAFRRLYPKLGRPRSRRSGAAIAGAFPAQLSPALFGRSFHPPALLWRRPRQRYFCAALVGCFPAYSRRFLGDLAGRRFLATSPTLLTGTSPWSPAHLILPFSRRPLQPRGTLPAPSTTSSRAPTLPGDSTRSYPAGVFPAQLSPPPANRGEKIG